MNYTCIYGCENGHCIYPPTNCSDSDGGVDAYTAAFTYGLVGSQPLYMEDKCMSYNSTDNYLAEYYCNNATAIFQTNIMCPFGCMNGVCTQGNVTGCSDSDGGIKIYQAGTTVYNGVYKYDSCSGSVLFEEYCKPGGIGEYVFPCPNGCMSGRCN
jgi:hypothetical protein